MRCEHTLLLLTVSFRTAPGGVTPAHGSMAAAIETVREKNRREVFLVLFKEHSGYDRLLYLDLIMSPSHRPFTPLSHGFFRRMLCGVIEKVMIGCWLT